MEHLTGLLTQLQSQTPVNSTSNCPNPGILTIQFVPFINSSVHMDVVKVILKETCITTISVVVLSSGDSQGF